MSALWIVLAVIAGIVIGGIIVVYLLHKAVMYGIGKGLGW